MNIYIYGNNDFREEIHSVLDQANIHFQIDEYGLIVDIDTLDELKKTIEDFPDYIYLIDESRIIKQNSFNSKFKFLQNKDSIEHKFLIEHGIEDIHIDDLSDIPKHIKERINIIEANKSFNNDESNIEESIIEIVDDAYENNNLDIVKELKEDNYFSENNFDTQINNENLDSFNIGNDDKEKLENIKEIEDVIKEIDNKDDDLNQVMNSFDEVNNSISSEYVNSFLEEIDKTIEDTNEEEDFSDILNNIEEEIDEDNTLHTFDTIDNKHKIEIDRDFLEGANMASDFTSLDELNENDILSALNGFESKNELSLDTSLKKEENLDETIKVDFNNISDISDLLNKLLNNKTLEITIKVKN